MTKNDMSLGNHNNILIVKVKIFNYYIILYLIIK